MLNTGASKGKPEQGATGAFADVNERQWEPFKSELGFTYQEFDPQVYLDRSYSPFLSSTLSSPASSNTNSSDGDSYSFDSDSSIEEDLVEEKSCQWPENIQSFHSSLEEDLDEEKNYEREKNSKISNEVEYASSLVREAATPMEQGSIHMDEADKDQLQFESSHRQFYVVDSNPLVFGEVNAQSTFEIKCCKTTCSSLSFVATTVSLPLKIITSATVKEKLINAEEAKIKCGKNGKYQKENFNNKLDTTLKHIDTAPLVNIWQRHPHIDMTRFAMTRLPFLA